MASFKAERVDADEDEMDQDSGESDKSSSSSDASDGSDTDDCSEIDEEECERRRDECIENLTDMENQFEVLKEQCVRSRENKGRPKRLYRERISQINKKLEEVHEGVAKEFCQPLEELQESMRNRIEVAGILRNLRLESIENTFIAEEEAALQNFENEKQILFDKMKEELEEKIRRLEEEHNAADFHSETVSQTDKSKKCSHNSRKGKGSWRKGAKPETSRRKPVSVSGPYIVYMLTEAEILEDWTAIKKALQSRKRSTERQPPIQQFV